MATFQGGQPLPAVGSAAYNSAAASSGNASYNPTTNAVTIAGNASGANIKNSNTGATGYQVPGAAIAPGWVPYTPGGGTPVPAATTPGGTLSPYFPRSFGTPDSGLSQSNENLTPKAPTSEDDLFQKYYAQSSQIIDSINEAEAAAESAANLTSQKDTSGAAYDLAREGMVGSSAAAGTASDIESKRGNAIAQAQAAKSKSLATLVSTIQSNAQAQANVEKTDNENLSAAYITRNQQQAQQSVKATALTGHSLDDIKSSDPGAYASLLQSYNGDPNAMKADWIAAAQANSLDGGKPIQSGSHLIFTFKDPATGKVFTQDIDTGVNLNADYTVAKDADGGMWLTNKTTGETKLLNGGAGGGATGSIAASRNALTISRYSMASNRIVANYLKLPAYQFLASATPMLSRIEAAIKQPGSVSDNDLLDSVIKLNTGGQAITEAQVSTITGGRSYADTVNVYKKKLSEQGGVLSDDQRKQLYDLSQSVYKNYQKAYQPVYDQASSQLEASGIPKQYWTLPDLNNLSTIGGTTTSIPQALMNTTDSSGTQVSPGDTIQDDSGNTYTVDGSGNLTPVTQ